MSRTPEEPAPAHGTAAQPGEEPPGRVRAVPAALAGLAFESAPTGLAVLDAAGHELAANHRWAALLGPGPDTPGGFAWTERLPAAVREAAQEIVERARSRGPGAVAGRLLAVPTGTAAERTLLLNVRATAVPGLCVAEVGEATEEVAERRVQLRLALDIASMAAWSVDLATGEDRWFAGSDELFGLQEQRSLIRDQLLAAFAPERQNTIAPTFARAALDGDGVFGTRFAMTDDAGRRRWMRVDARVHQLGRPPHRWLVGVTRDITDEMTRRGALEERVEAEAERSAQIEEVATALLSASTAGDVASAVTDRFHQGLGAIGALVLVPENGLLRPLATSGAGARAGEAMDGLPVAAAVPASRVIREGVPYFVRSHEEFRALSEGDPYGLLAVTAARSWAMLPLRRGERLPGALVLGYAEQRSFPPEERTLLLALAGLTGQALERSALVQQRIDLAQAVQHVLMPEALPRLPGLRLAARYTPASDGIAVGGDWYDAFLLPDGRYGLSIGDVEGHDVQAAATMGPVRTALRAYAQTETSPGRVLAATNELLCALGGSYFATCTYLVIDPASNALSAATAGHVPGILGLKDGATRLLAPPPGPPLGVLPKADYPTVRHSLAPVCCLVLLTDGLVEGPQIDLDAGLALACEAVGAHRHSDPEVLAAALLRASRLTGHLDDASLLAARWDAPGARDRQAG